MKAPFKKPYRKLSLTKISPTVLSSFKEDVIKRIGSEGRIAKVIVSILGNTFELVRPSFLYKKDSVAEICYTTSAILPIPEGWTATQVTNFAIDAKARIEFEFIKSAISLLEAAKKGKYTPKDSPKVDPRP